MYFETEDKLREYILDELFSKTYRELVVSRKFNAKTGIKSLGTLTYYAKKLKITIEAVYERAIETGRLRKNCNFEEFLVLTRRQNVINKIKHKDTVEKRIVEHKREALIDLANKIGLTFNDNDSDELIIMCLKDFIPMSKIEKAIENLN